MSDINLYVCGSDYDVRVLFEDLSCLDDITTFLSGTLDPRAEDL
jgi:hypothetical protein